MALMRAETRSATGIEALSQGNEAIGAGVGAPGAGVGPVETDPEVAPFWGFFTPSLFFKTQCLSAPAFHVKNLHRGVVWHVWQQAAALAETPTSCRSLPTKFVSALVVHPASTPTMQSATTAQTNRMLKLHVSGVPLEAFTMIFLRHLTVVWIK
jgi:hypothetical protein